ncbi:DUF6588 family protein [Salegentibacter chungangensis]|uniref:DUF6588 family protein n=1 Tax=Salegentibacter chungangensis TaxID=1335724 RepID=A0ABW3NUT0_9FLAO
MKRYLISLLTLLMFVVSNSYAQKSTSFEGFVTDMKTIAGNFASPASNGAAYQASAGWFSSAAPLETWDVRFSVHGNALFVPTSEKSFTISKGELGFLSIEDADNAKLPTAFGSSTDVYFTGRLEGEFNGQNVSQDVRFKALDGINKGFVPHAFVQASVGLPYGTELTVRAMPEVTIDDVQASTFGAGLKHNLSQYFSRNEPENLQLAAGISYSKFNVKYAFEPIPIENYLVMDLIDVDANLWMGEFIASKQYGGFEIFGALGATSSDFKYVMGGSGDFLDNVNVELEDLGDTEIQFKGDIGFNMYFNNLRVSTMATAGKFFNLNLGIHYTL